MKSSRSTGGIVDPVYLGGDLNDGGLQRDDRPNHESDLGLEPLYLRLRLDAEHRSFKAVRRRRHTADPRHGPDSILKRSHDRTLPRIQYPLGSRRTQREPSRLLCRLGEVLDGIAGLIDVAPDRQSHDEPVGRPADRPSLR